MKAISMTFNLHPTLIDFFSGETCCDREGNIYANFIQRELDQQVIVRSVKMGESKEDDFTYSLTIHPFEQVRGLWGGKFEGRINYTERIQ